MAVVLKFGGSCLTSKDDILKSIKIVKTYEQPIIVVSAFKGVTDELIAQAKNAQQGKYDLKKLEEVHFSSLEGLSKQRQEETKHTVQSFLASLSKDLTKVSYAHEITAEMLDQIMSYGERLVIQIIAAYFNDNDLPAVALSDKEAGIFTDDNFGNGVILESSIASIKQKLSLNQIPIVAGFVGKNRGGEITTLGRGGSDYTAAFIAAAFKCDCILLKDVKGLMTGDPKIIPKARIIPSINYLNALELANYGSKVIYSKAILPAMQSDISIKIKEFSPENHIGTVISDKMTDVIVIQTMKEVSIINLIGYTEMMKTFADIITEFAAKDIYPLLLTESSYGEISIVVNEKETDRIENIVRKLSHKSHVQVKRGYSSVSVVGNAMKGKVGTAAKVFGILAQQEINIIAISQSASESSISVIISREHLEAAANALHKTFVENQDL
ncbi:aspartate kinase [Candidatus Micrarchaeota archaeon]|nr:aspartate kinase [Candidatus Micrarchaeota archaeon]